MPSNRAFVLTPLQKRTLEALARSALGNKFYWTGGTALAFFYLHHRFSYDLDFFSDKQFRYGDVAPFIKGLAEELKLKKITEKKIHDRWEFFLANHEETRIEFVFYNFQPLKSRKRWKGLWVDSLEDMAANKTMAMLDRNEPKDAFDIYFLLQKSGFTPEKLLGLVNKKFKTSFTPSLFWSEALKGSRGLNTIRPLLKGSADEQKKQTGQIVSFFEKQSAEFVRSKFLD